MRKDERDPVIEQIGKQKGVHFTLQTASCERDWPKCDRQAVRPLIPMPTNGILGMRRAERNGSFEPGTFRILLAYRTQSQPLTGRHKKGGEPTGYEHGSSRG